MLENCTAVVLKIRQCGCKEVKSIESQSTQQLTWQTVHEHSLRLLQLCVASGVDKGKEAADMAALLAERRASNAAASSSAGCNSDSGYAGQH